MLFSTEEKLGLVRLIEYVSQLGARKVYQTIEYAIPNQPPARFPRFHCPKPALDYLEKICQVVASKQEIMEVFDGKQFNCGGCSETIHILSLAQWLVIKSKTIGADCAVALLEEFMCMARSPAWDNLAISGVKVISPIKISDCIEVAAINSVGTQSVKLSASPKNIVNPGISGGFLVADEKHATAVIRKKIWLKKVVEEQSDYYVKDQFKLDDVRLILILKNGFSPQPFHRWTELKSWVPQNMTSMTGISAGEPELKYKDLQVLSQSIWDELKPVYEGFQSLPMSSKTLVRACLNRIGQSKVRRRLEDRAIDLGVALESLLVVRNESEITTRFASRACWLITGSPATRSMAEYKFFKQVYACRSDAVHSGKVKQEYKDLDDQRIPVAGFLDLATRMGLVLVKKTIEMGGLPSWNHVHVVRRRRRRTS